MYMYRAAVHSLDAEFTVLEMTTSNAFFSRELKILYHFIHASILPTYLFPCWWRAVSSASV